MHRRQFVEMGLGAMTTGWMPAIGGLQPSAGAAGARAVVATMTAAAFHDARRFIDTRFGRIAYVERGKGDAAVFLHGFPLNGFQWRGAIERPPPHRRSSPPRLRARPPKWPTVRAPRRRTKCISSSCSIDSRSRGSIVASDSGARLRSCSWRDTRIASHAVADELRHRIDSPPPALLPVIELSR